MSEKRKRCERCGEDLTLYKKILRASNLYYNNGLSRARVRDLSGAIIALKNSLELNKTNINARNLLGLIYFEMGETVAALSEWVISKHFKPEDNDADDYINSVQSNPTKLDNFNQAIKRYNNALSFAKQGSDDLAIIQLKKVTALNPHFIRAYHLLALLYMKNGDTERAKKYLIKAGKIDVSNTTTLRYMRELEPINPLSKDNEGNSDGTTSLTNTIMPVSTYREDKPNIMAFVNLVIGVVLGIALMAFLMIPTIKKNQTTAENEDYIDFSAGIERQQEQEETILALQQELADLEQENEQLKDQIESFVIPEDNPKLYDPLFQAFQLYMNELNKPEDDRDLTAIADALVTIDEAQYESEAAVGLLNRLKNELYPTVADIYYDIGHDLYGDRKYEEAIVELNKSVTLNPAHVDAIYFTARAYHRLEDYENAAIYYDIVVKDFPDSNRYKNAKDFLEDVQP
ncbi:tetratricopeptide repeat protein [Mobilitalea sibirica]|nr:tetratricopeptide repeat protein [Mobilitalea sibirica]